MSPELSGIGLTIGIKLLERATPTGIAWLETKIWGKKIHIVGQPESGKTSFIDYFQYGIFTDPSIEAERTKHTIKTASFQIAIEPSRALELKVKTAIDPRGQDLSSDHVNFIFKFKPDSVVIIVDLNSDWEGKTEYEASFYLNNFCNSFAHRLHGNKNLSEKIKSVIIVLNKQDLVPPQKFKTWKTNVENIISQTMLIQALGNRKVPIMPCTLIKNDKPGETPDAIITQIARSLTSR